MANLDEMTLQALRDNGADLGKPRETVHYVYFSRQDEAKRAAARVNGTGRVLDVRMIGGEWLLEVRQTMLVGPTSVRMIREELERAAKPEGGEYDGWEAALD